MKNKRVVSIIMELALIVTLLPVMPASAKVKLSATSKTLEVGKSTTLKVTGTKKKVKWSSSNKKVATVTQKGKVTAKKVGTSTIKAKVSGKTYKCKVSVKGKNAEAEETPIPSETKEPTPTSKPDEKDGVVKIGKVLCEDENISVTFKEIKNGKIILSIKNKCDNDITFGNRYVIINGTTYYDDIFVVDIYAGTEKEFDATPRDDDWKDIPYTYNGGSFSGRCYYILMDGDKNITDERDMNFSIEI